MKNRLTVEVITTDTPTTEIKSISGWGDNAHNTNVTGEVQYFSVLKDGKRQFGFHILENGTLHFTDYANMCYQLTISNGTVLEPMAPWENEKKQKKAKNKTKNP